MRTLLTFAFTTLILLLPIAASGYCTPPYAPEVPSSYSKPEKPGVPYCVNEYAGTHTCDDWEISSYRDALQRYQSEVNAYVRTLQSYASAASAYASAAVQYAKCEISGLD